MAAIANLVVRISADVAAFEKGISGVERSLRRQGQQWTQLGTQLTAGLTLPLVGIGIAATKMATDLNASMANVATLIPGNVARVNELKTAVQDMAIATGKSTEDLANGLYQVISAFGDSADSARLLEVSAKASVAGLSSTTDAINLISAVTKGYGDTSVEAAHKASDLAFMTVKLGQTTFPELAHSMGRVVPIAATLNVAQEELFAGFATLTGVTGNTSEVSTQLASVLRGMLKPTEGMSRAIQQLGFSGSEAMVSSLGLVGSLQQLLSTTDGSAEAVGKLFGRAEGLSAVFALTGSQAGTFADKLGQINDAAGATDAAFREQTEGINRAGFAWKQFQQELAVTAQRLGDALIPHLLRAAEALKPLLSGVINLVNGFGKLPQPIQTVAIAFLGVAAALGPLMLVYGQVLLLMARGISLFGAKATAIKVLATSFFGLKAVLVGASAGFVALVPAIWPVGAAVAALGAALYFIPGLWDAVKNAVSAVIAPFRLLWDLQVSLARTLIEFGQELGRITGITNLARDAWRSFASAASDVWSIAKDVTSILKNSLIIAVNRLASAFETLKAKTLAVVEGVLGPLVGDFERFGRVLTRVVIPAIKAMAAQMVLAIPGMTGLIQTLAVIRGVDLSETAASMRRVAEAVEHAAGKAETAGEAFEELIAETQDLGPAIKSGVVAPMLAGAAATSGMSDEAKKLADRLAYLRSVTAPIDRPRSRGIGEDIGIPQLPRIAELRIALADFWAETARMNRAGAENLAFIFKQLPGKVVEISPPKPLPPTFWQQLFGDTKAIGASLGDSIMRAIQGGGNIFAAAAGALGQTLTTKLAAYLTAAKDVGGRAISGFLGGAIQAVLPGIGALMGPLVNKITEIFAGLFNRNRGRRMVEEFAEGFGGFDALQRRLQEMGAEGERLWIRLTQGVGRNNPEQAAAAIAEVQAALDRFGTASERAERRVEALGKAVAGVNTRADLFARPFLALAEAMKNAEGSELDELQAKMAETAQRGQAEFERLGLFVGATFAALVNETGDAIGAIRQLEPSFRVLQQGIKEFGLESTATIDQLLNLFNLVNDEASGPILQSIQATGQIFTSLQDAGYMTASLFQSVSDDIGASFRRLEEQGGDVAAAMALSQPVLQALWEAQQRYGAVTDDTTASILRQAEEQGIVGNHMKDVNRQILDVLIAIADVFGAVLPESFRRAGDGATEAVRTIERELSGINIPPIEIDIQYNDPGFTGGSGRTNIPALAHGGIVRRPTLALVGEAGPEAVVPLSQMGSVAPQSGNVTTVLEVDGRVFAEVTAPHLPGVARHYVRA